MENKYLTVSAITRYLKAKIDLDENLKHVFIKGEISNFKAHTSGHLYFSLKDDGSKINAIMFKTNASKLTFSPDNGTKVLITGRISIYEQTGNYQIYVDDMIEDGIGNLYIAFEKLKKELEKEGLFKEEHKKPIPKFPKKVGVITASTGAAVRDIITTIKRRYPICEIILFPTLVQGENAKEDIVKNIQKAENYDLDVLILGRGGGSIEDLWAFNEEIVARAIYNCQIPTISAVGHEIDFTISDFVSDLRAPTPTAAAEMAVPNLLDLQNHITQLNIRLKESINKKINYQKLYLDSVKNSFVIKNPMIMYENKKQTIDLMGTKIKELVIRKYQTNKEKINHLKNNYIFTKPEILYQSDKQNLRSIIEKLELLNPLNTLNRGYSITYSNGKVVKDINDVKEEVSIKLHNGSFKAKVIEKEGEK